MGIRRTPYVHTKEATFIVSTYVLPTHLMDVIVSSVQRHHQSPHGQQQSSTMKSIIYLIVSIIWLSNRSSDAFTPSNARNSCIRRRESSYGYDRVLLFATADEDVKSAPMGKITRSLIRSSIYIYNMYVCMYIYRNQAKLN